MLQAKLETAIKVIYTLNYSFAYIMQAVTFFQFAIQDICYLRPLQGGLL